MKNWKGIYYFVLPEKKSYSFNPNLLPYKDYVLLESPSECFMLIPKAPGDWDCD